MHGPDFLHRSNPQLNSSTEVELSVAYLRAHGAVIADRPADRIAAYLSFLADPQYVNDGYLTGDEPSIKRQVDFHTIKSHEVPQSHFKREARIAQENGQGFIEYSERQKDEMASRISHNQQTSLRRWIDYLNGPFSRHEDWFKFYVLNGVVKLGDFDREQQTFNRRTNNSTGMFADLNPEAVSMVYDIINRHGGTLNHLSFGKLYSNELRTQEPMEEAQRQVTDGSWKLYECIGDDEMIDEPVLRIMYRHPTVFELTRSLQGKATGWCTAGEADAAGQLIEGDFYVYYSKDPDGKDTVPRVAIRTDSEGFVVEVRGVGIGQQVEPIMLDITLEKLQELPGGPEYFKKVDQMKSVTRIYDAVMADPTCELSQDDLHLIYEVGGYVGGFSLTENTDPRINEIRQFREAVFSQDIRRAFNLRDDLSIAGQLLTEPWEDAIQKFDNGEDDELTDKEKQLLLCYKNFEILARADSIAGQRHMFEYIQQQNDHFRDKANKIALLTGLGAVSQQEAYEALFKDDPRAIVEALWAGVFTAGTFQFTRELLETVLNKIGEDEVDLEKLFSSDALNGLIAGTNTGDGLLRAYITAGFSSHNDAHSSFRGVLLEAYTDEGLALPYPSNSVIRLMNPRDKRRYIRKWESGSKEYAPLIVSLLALDTLLNAAPNEDKQLYKHKLNLNEEVFNALDHNNLAQALARTRPDILELYLADLRNLSTETFGAIANAGLSGHALKCLGSFAKDIDFNQVIAEAVRANPHSIYAVKSVLEHGKRLRTEVLEALTDAAACKSGELIKAYDSFTPEAQVRILRYVSYDSPLTLLQAKKDLERFVNRDNRFYSNTIGSYVSDSFVADIDYSYLFTAMISVPTNCRLAIVNRSLFPEGVFDDQTVVATLQSRGDNRTLYWALDKDLLQVSDGQKRRIMQEVQADPEVQAYSNRDRSLDVPDVELI